MGHKTLYHNIYHWLYYSYIWVGFYFYHFVARILLALVKYINLLFFRNPYNIYYKVLMNNAATSALRLHQRVPRVQLTRQFLETLLLEDSCHYLFYSFIFLYAAPVTCILSIFILLGLLN